MIIRNCFKETTYAKRNWGVLAFLLLFNSASYSQNVEFRTASLLNAQYLTVENWSESIPMNDESHDVNHPQYGGKYYPPISMQLQSPDDRNTLARGFLMIEADLVNQSDQQLVLEKINLQVKERYAKPEDAKSLEWEVGNRGSGYNPYFIMDGEESVFTNLPEDFVLYPAGEPQDSRISLEVECYEADRIVLFQFELIFFAASDPTKKIKIQSDRQYLIASE